MTLQINVRSYNNLSSLVAFRSFWDMNDCLCKHTNIRRQRRLSLWLISAAWLHLQRLRHLCWTSWWVSLPVRWMNRHHWLSGHTEQGRLFKSRAHLFTEDLRTGCSGRIFQCKRHEFGTIFSAVAKDCVVSLNGYRFSVTQQTKVTGKHYSQHGVMQNCLVRCVIKAISSRYLAAKWCSRNCSITRKLWAACVEFQHIAAAIGADYHNTSAAILSRHFQG